MEARAPYGPPAPVPGPRNLTVLLAQWLRRMGFLVSEQGGVAPTAISASWRAPDGLLYEASYAFTPQSGGIFQLLARHDNPLLTHHGLVHKAEINRLREARFLLLSNVYYAQARQAALTAGTLQPAHLTTP
ncbi:MAG: hypothetical protein JWP58_3261 [Hymenobacter sp.]|nr:hypothetical protein [Hymenobacter sp.]